MVWQSVQFGRRFGVGFGLERHIAAVTASIDFHDRFPEIPQIGMDDSYSPTGLIVRSGSNSAVKARSRHVRSYPTIGLCWC
jgi:hypothetical protein